MTCCGDGASSPVLPQVVEIKNGSGDTTDQFVWGPAYVDELLLHERDADGDPNNVLEQRLYAAHDTLYSVLRLTDEDGNVVEQYSYSPYGADPTDPRKGVARITDADDNELTPDDSVAEYLYTGRQFDKAVGLNYHRARRLSHNLGRWTRRDPLGVSFMPADLLAQNERQLIRHPIGQYADGANVYAYANGRAIAATDPDGLRPDGLRNAYRLLEYRSYRLPSGQTLLTDPPNPYCVVYEKYKDCVCVCAGCAMVSKGKTRRWGWDESIRVPGPRYKCGNYVRNVPSPNPAREQFERNVSKQADAICALLSAGADGVGSGLDAREERRLRSRCQAHCETKCVSGAYSR